jgi:predicted GNAT family acetyltransferase
MSDKLQNQPDLIDEEVEKAIRSPRNGHTIRQLRQLKEAGWHNADTGTELQPDEAEDHLKRLEQKAADKKVIDLTRARKKRQAKEAIAAEKPEDWDSVIKKSFSERKRKPLPDGYSTRAISDEGFMGAELHHKGKKVGFVEADHDGNSLDISVAQIDKKHRGKGLSVPMYEALYAHAAKKGVKHVSGFQANSDAMRTHESLARRHGLKLKVYDNDEDETQYGYSLKKAEKAPKPPAHRIAAGIAAQIKELGTHATHGPVKFNGIATRSARITTDNSTDKALIEELAQNHAHHIPEGHELTIREKLRAGDSNAATKTYHLAVLKKDGLAKVLDSLDGDTAMANHHGWISPEGKFHKMGPDEFHGDWIRNHLKMPHGRMDIEDISRDAHDKGWISVGHEGGSNASVPEHVLKDKNHPAMKTLRNMVGSNDYPHNAIDITVHPRGKGWGEDEEFHYGNDVKHLSRYGMLRAHPDAYPEIMKSEEPKLHINDNQARWLKHGAEAIGTYEMHPEEFLKLTTHHENEAQAIKSRAKPLEFYNSPEINQDMSVHPHVTVNHEGKVVGHEGRHRAAAIANAGGSKIRVAVVAQDSKEFHDKYGWRWKRNIPAPAELHGQFSDHSHKIDQAKFERIHREEEK